MLSPLHAGFEPIPFHAGWLRAGWKGYYILYCKMLHIFKSYMYACIGIEHFVPCEVIFTYIYVCII